MATGNRAASLPGRATHYAQTSARTTWCGLVKTFMLHTDENKRVNCKSCLKLIARARQRRANGDRGTEPARESGR